MQIFRIGEVGDVEVMVRQKIMGISCESLHEARKWFRLLALPTAPIVGGKAAGAAEIFIIPPSNFPA